jgi:hypothetical protein
MKAPEFRITWSRNAVGGRQSGTDTAHELEEAIEIATARVRYGGIPATARISVAGHPVRDWLPVRDYWKDFDARIGWQDSERAAA